MQKPEKKKRKLLIPILLLVLLIGAAGVFLWDYLSQGIAYGNADRLAQQGQYQQALEAFRELGSYSDSRDRVAELEPLAEQMEQYRKGMEYLEKGKYEKAIKAFQNAGSYADAVDQESHARLAQALEYLEAGEISQAMESSQWMTEADQAELEAALRDTVQDYKALEALEEALTVRMRLLQGNPTDRELCENELEYMEEFESGIYLDGELQKWIQYYIEGIYVQYNTLPSDGNNTEDALAWMTGAAMRCEAVDELIATYQFLSNNKDVRDYYEGWGDCYWAMAEIEELLEDQLWGRAASRDGDLYFIRFKNYSYFDFTLDVRQEYSLNGEYLDETYEFTITIPAREVTDIYLQFPETQEFSKWYINWTIYDIYHGSEKLD